MLRVGDTVGRYVIEGVLGEGGMGRVYKALDPSLGRHVALKVLIANGGSEADRAEAAARMMREARSAAAFMHPNVVAIHDVGVFEGAPFIAMELVSGSTLRAFAASGAVPNDQKLRWLIDVARGLEAAHRAGLVHRDIKPENVMVTTDGVVKVLDFGIARRAEGDSVDASNPTQAANLGPVTAEGLVIGTPQYMAPEQLRATPLDGRCDQYAWGVMAYELFAGALPWRGKTGVHLLTAVLDGAVAPLREVVPSIDPRISDVVARAMASDRQARFPSMAEACDALAPGGAVPARAVVVRGGDHIDVSAATTAQPVASVPSPPNGAAKGRMGPVVAAALGAVVVLIAGIAATRVLSARRIASRQATSPDVPILGALPPSRTEEVPSPWQPPPDGEFHLWSSGSDHGFLHSDMPRYCRPFLEALSKNFPGPDPEKVQAVWLATPTAGLPPEQVELCRSAKALAFGHKELAIVSLATEVRATLAQMGANAGAVAQDRLALGESPWCPSAKPIPAALPAPGVRVETQATDWTSDPGWSCLRFTLRAPTSFQYRFDSTSTSATLSARAHVPVGERLWKLTATVTAGMLDGHLVAAATEVKWDLE